MKATETFLDLYVRICYNDYVSEYFADVRSMLWRRKRDFALLRKRT